jgi:mannose/fructose/N-acetylgalactosamine-specific phosphotransferase system component IIB
VEDPRGTVVLLRNLRSLERLWRGGFRPRAPIYLGGLHARPGSRELLRYLHLTPEDEEILRRLLAEGCPLAAQDLPTAPRRDAAWLRRVLEV